MRLAWKRIAADYPDVESDFAGQPQKMLLNAAVLDEDKLQFDPFRLLLWPDRVGDNFIRPDDYDALLITACSFGPLAVMNFYRDMSFFGLKRKAQHVIPRERFIAASRRALNATAAMHICQTWRQLSTKPVVVIPNPLPSETGFGENDQPVMEIWKQCRAHGDEEALLGVFASVTAAFETEFGFTFLPQADITRHGPISTKPLYCENAVSVLNRTEISHAADDYFHMNDIYGEVMWQAAIGKIRELTGV